MDALGINGHVQIQNGHLEVLQYLHENGCPWNQNACLYAAKYGHLKVLEYLHQNGCPWDEEACLKASKSNGHLTVAKWCITTQRSDGSKNLSDQDKVR